MVGYACACAVFLSLQLQCKMLQIVASCAGGWACRSRLLNRGAASGSLWPYKPSAFDIWSKHLMKYYSLYCNLENKQENHTYVTQTI